MCEYMCICMYSVCIPVNLCHFCVYLCHFCVYLCVYCVCIVCIVCVLCVLCVFCVYCVICVYFWGPTWRPELGVYSGVPNYRARIRVPNELFIKVRELRGGVYLGCVFWRPELRGVLCIPVCIVSILCVFCVYSV